MHQLGESISIFNCIDVQQELLDYLNKCEEECIIDASLLEDIDAAGIQVIASLVKYGHKNNKLIKIEQLRDEIMTLFKKLGLEILVEKENV